MMSPGRMTEEFSPGVIKLTTLDDFRKHFIFPENYSTPDIVEPVPTDDTLPTDDEKYQEPNGVVGFGGLFIVIVIMTMVMMMMMTI